MNQPQEDSEGLGFVTPVLPRYTGRASQEWLLLPGWAQTGEYWVTLARWLSSTGVALWCADLGAIAASCPGPRGSLRRTTQMVDRLAELVRGRPTTALVAHSAGAALAVLLADRIPGLRAIALVEPVAGHFGIGCPLGEVDGSTARQTAVATALAHLPVPALVVRGEGSTLLSETEAKALLAAVPNGAGCLLIDRAGHSPHVDRPRETAVALGTLAELAGIERRDEQ